MLIPFCSKIKVAGQTFRHRPFESHKPHTTFADKKGTASVFFISHIVEHWKKNKSATLIVEYRKGGYLKMRDNHLMKSNGKFYRAVLLKARIAGWHRE